ncbi:hypothetical protein CHE86_22610 [Salmonella enterica]|nr:hypothetical protein CHE86_22610 [Salmonella enterica]
MVFIWLLKFNYIQDVNVINLFIMFLIYVMSVDKWFSDGFVFYISMWTYNKSVGMGVILFPLFVSGGFYVAELD